MSLEESMYNQAKKMTEIHYIQHTFAGGGGSEKVLETFFIITP